MCSPQQALGSRVDDGDGRHGDGRHDESNG